MGTKFKFNVYTSTLNLGPFFPLEHDTTDGYFCNKEITHDIAITDVTTDVSTLSESKG